MSTSDPVETEAAGAISETPPHAPETLPHTRFSRAADAFLDALGRRIAWVWLLLLTLVLANVVLRYVFGEGRVELEELQWHLYAAGFLAALSFGVVHDDHVRVDVLHEHFSPRRKAWVEFYGVLLLLLPFLALVLIHSLPFVAAAWATSEVSQAPGGLPMRWLIKAALPAGFVLLALGVISRFTRVTALLFHVPRPIAPPPGSA